VSGGVLYRKASFLVDHIGKPVFPSFDSTSSSVHGLRAVLHRQISTAKAWQRATPIWCSDGHLSRYVLGSYSARKLGLTSTGNAGGVHNVLVSHGELDFAGMLQATWARGLLVTELMGQGVPAHRRLFARRGFGFLGGRRRDRAMRSTKSPSPATCATCMPTSSTSAATWIGARTCSPVPSCLNA
jgi:PmbA protein